MPVLTEPAKLLLLVSLLAKDRVIPHNAKAFLKELILRRDARLLPLIAQFEAKESTDVKFLEELHNLICHEARSLYDDLFADTHLEVGKALSKSEREEKQLTEDKSLIYGEVEFDSFYRVLRKINAEPGKIFYDLGSGTGKAVFVARLTQDFEKCIGIEILHSLHKQAQTIVARYQNQYKQALTLGQSHYAQVFEGSVLDFDWSDGDVVFANSTCFGDDLMYSLSIQAENLKPGSIFVSFTKGLTSTKFELLERKRYRMSWGPATVFIHRRLNYDNTPVGPARLNLLPSDNITYDEEILQMQAQQNSDEDEEDEDEEEDDDSQYEYEDGIDEQVKEFDEDDGEEEDVDEEDEEDEDEDLEEEDTEDDDADDDADDDEDDDDDEEADAKEEFVYKSTPTRSPGQSQYGAQSKSTPSPAKFSTGSSPAKTPTSASSSFNSALLNSSPKIVGGTPQKPPALSPASAAAGFAALNSPQDTALLMRRRISKPAAKHECVDSDDGEDN